MTFEEYMELFPDSDYEEYCDSLLSSKDYADQVLEDYINNGGEF